MTATLLMLMATAATPVDAGVTLTPAELFARKAGRAITDVALAPGGGWVLLSL